MMYRGLISVLLLGYMMPGWAIQEAGQVIFVAGTVTAQRADTITLKKSDQIFENDLIVTAARSRGQLLMKDGAKFSLRPGTEFAVEEYFLVGDEREQADGSVVLASQNGAVTSLIKGGFRTITGAIGKEDPEEYVVNSPAATMGVRGTHYSVVWCAGDCQLPDAAGDADPIKDGLYVSVTQGSVVISNLSGEYTMGAGEIVYVKDFNASPVALPEPPRGLIDTASSEDESEKTDEETAQTDEAAAEVGETVAALGSKATVVGLGPSVTIGQGSGFTNRLTPAPVAPAEEDPEEESVDEPLEDLLVSFDRRCDRLECGFDFAPDIPFFTDTMEDLDDGIISSSRAVALGSGPIVGLSPSVFTGSSNQGLRTFSGNDFIAFQSPPATVDSSYAIGSSSIRNQGFDPVTGIGWGRWTMGSGTVTQADGSVVSADLTNQSLHWVYGPDTGPPVMPLAGTANYTLIAGNTDPTDTLGNTGILGRTSLMANFTTAMVQSNLSLSINGSVWEANGSGTITSNLFNGLYNNVLIGGQDSGNGNFSGFFGTPGTNGFPSGAGLTYGLTDGLNQSISGAVIFGAPSP